MVSCLRMRHLAMVLLVSIVIIKQGLHREDNHAFILYRPSFAQGKPLLTLIRIFKSIVSISLLFLSLSISETTSDVGN